MRPNLKKILSVMLLFCMIITVMLGSATETQAAKYSKSISKSIKEDQCVDGYPTVLTFTLKQAATVTITFSCPVATEDDYYRQASISTSGETVKVTTKNKNPKYIANEKDYNKVTMKVKFPKGTQTITIYGNSADSYKLKVTATKNILKFKSLENIVGEDVG